MASGGGGGGSGGIPIPLVVRYAFTFQGNLDTTDNALIPWLPGQGDSVTKATGQVKSAPAGTDITIDILLIKRSDGSTVSTLGTLTIASGNLVGDLVFSSTLVDSDHALAISITQVGSISAGANLTVVVT
jgi:hypothetical protein